jgi:hypothetical protein
MGERYGCFSTNPALARTTDQKSSSFDLGAEVGHYGRSFGAEAIGTHARRCCKVSIEKNRKGNSSKTLSDYNFR